jgi:hypothetical protein
MTLAIVTICSILPFPADCGPPPVSGYVSQYDPWLMWETAVQQEAWGKIDDLWRYDGFIATAECDIGREGYLSIEGGEPLFVVAVDCSGHASTTRWMRENNIICEVSHSLAMQFDMVGRGGIVGEIQWLN